MKINPKLKDAIEWIICIIIAIVIALLVRFYIGTPTVVESISMDPTLHEGQRLWINRWGRTTKQMPERGQIITFEQPSQARTTSSEDVDKTNPIAKYDNEPQSLLGKFFYYSLELTKRSYIKRVIALPGEHIHIEDGYIYINGEILEENYLSKVTDTKSGVYDDFIVPKDTVFVMGDNRANSLDSRAFGCIPLEKIEGTLSFRFWPINLFGKVD